MAYQGKEKDAFMMIGRKYRLMLDKVGEFNKRKARQQMEFMIERDYQALPLEFQDINLEDEGEDE